MPQKPNNLSPLIPDPEILKGDDLDAFLGALPTTGAAQPMSPAASPTPPAAKITPLNVMGDLESLGFSDRSQAMTDLTALFPEDTPDLLDRLPVPGSIERGLRRGYASLIPDLTRLDLYDPEKGSAEIAEQMRRVDKSMAQLAKEDLEVLAQLDEAKWEDTPQILGMLARNPQVVATLFGESTPATAAMMGAGLAVSAALPPMAPIAAALISGLALAGTSFYVDSRLEALNALQDADVDIRSNESVLQALTDEKKMEEIRESAAAHGLGVAAFDAAAFGLAGRFLRMAKEGGRVAKLAAISAEMAQQGLTEAAGEASGQVLQGKEVKAGEVIAEGVVGLAGSVFETPTEILIKRMAGAEGDEARYLASLRKYLNELNKDRQKIEEEGLSGAVYVPPGNEEVAAQLAQAGIEGGGFTHFGKPEDLVNDILVEREGLGGVTRVENVNQAEQVRLRLERVNPDQLSADLRDIALEQLTVDNENVRLLNPELAAEALADAQNAVQQMQAATTAQEIIAAQRQYEQALSKGFRFDLQSTRDSFVLIGEAPAEAIVRGTSPLNVRGVSAKESVIENPAVLLGQVDTIQGGEKVTDIRNPRKTVANLKQPSAAQERRAGTFFVDLARVPNDQKHNVTADDVLAKLPDGAFASFEAFQAAVEATEGIRFDDSKGVSQKQAFEALKARKEKKEKTSVGSSLVRLTRGEYGIRGYDPTLVDNALQIIGEMPRSALSRIPPAPRWERRSHRLVEGADKAVQKLENSLVDVNGKPLVTKRGEAVFGFAPGNMEGYKANKELFDGMLAAANELMKKFKLTDRSLIIIPDGVPGTQYSTGGGVNGWQFGSSLGKTQAIAVSSKVNPEHMVGTFWHEFGHFLVYAEFGRIPAELQQALLQAYARDQLQAELTGGAGIFTNFYPASRVDFSLLANPQMLHASMKELEASQGTVESRADYLSSFDEWIADQISRYYAEPSQGLSVTEKFFKDLAAKLVQVFEVVKEKLAKWMNVDVVQFKAQDAVVDFVEYLAAREGPSVGGVHPAAEAAAAGAVESAINKSWVEEHGIEPVADQGYQLETSKLLESFNIPKKQRDLFKAANDYFFKFMKVGYSLQQVAMLNPHIQGLQLYRELVDRWDFERQRIYSRAEETVKAWSAIGGKQADAVGRLLLAVDSMEYLSNTEVDEGVVRHPTDTELARLAQKYGVDENGLEIYHRVRSDFNSMIDEMEQAAISDEIALILEQAKDEPGKEAWIEENTKIAIGRLKAEFTQLRKAPYFPHVRFGKFGILVKDRNEKTVFFSQAETAKLAKLSAIELSKKYTREAGYNVSIGEVPQITQPLQGMPPAILKSLARRLQLDDKQKAIMDAFIAENMPSRSFKKRLLRRNNIPGYSTDAMRAYASYFFHGANYIARLKYKGRLDQSIQVMRDERNMLRKQLGSEANADVRKRDGIIDMTMDHLQYIMNPKPDWARMRGFAFIWHLGFNVKSAFVNLTQVPMVSFPYLSARFGNVAAARAISRAYKNIQSTWAKVRVDDSNLLFRAINRGVEQGILDESLAKELAGVAEGSNLKRLLPGPRGARQVRMLGHWASFLFAGAEKINRSVTFRAAFEMAMANPELEWLAQLEATNQLEFKDLVDNGWSRQEARAYLAARDAVHSTQFRYAKHARPAFMRGGFSGTLFTFFSFLQNSLVYMAHQPGRVKYIMTLLLLSGFMGLPFSDDIKELVKFASKKMGLGYVDLEMEGRKLILALLGDNPALPPDLFLHGIGRYGLGLPAAGQALGLPIPTFDLSASIGMGQLIPGVGGLSREGDFDAAVGRAVTDASGATFGIGLNILKALGDNQLPWNDFKRIERMLPTAFRNLSRSARYLSEGRERTRSGATVVDFDVTDPEQLAEIVAVAAGFQPTRVSQKWSREIAKAQVLEYWTTRRGMLLRQFDQADFIPGTPARSDVIAAIQRFNKTLPKEFKGLGISNKTLRQSKKQRTRTRVMQELGYAGSKATIPANKALNELFPEVEDIEPAPR